MAEDMDLTAEEQSWLDRYAQEEADQELAIQLALEADNALPGDVDPNDDDPMAVDLADRSTWTRCVVCDDQWENFLPPCSHPYCAGCLTGVFQHSMDDENMFPPRCCQQELVVEDVRAVLDADFLARFETKAVEWRTTNRIYCHQTECTTFIPSIEGPEENALCPTCGARTCKTCKGAAHVLECPDDEAFQQLLATAQAEGWRRCRVCSRMIELNHGCNHMTCTCGHHFCYMCGGDWRPKTCRCPQWEEHRLLIRAVGLVERERAVPVAARPADVVVIDDGDDVLEDAAPPADEPVVGPVIEQLIADIVAGNAEDVLAALPPLPPLEIQEAAAPDLPLQQPDAPAIAIEHPNVEGQAAEQADALLADIPAAAEQNATGAEQNALEAQDADIILDPEMDPGPFEAAQQPAPPVIPQAPPAAAPAQAPAIIPTAPAPAPAPATQPPAPAAVPLTAAQRRRAREIRRRRGELLNAADCAHPIKWRPVSADRQRIGTCEICNEMSEEQTQMSCDLGGFRYYYHAA